MSPRLRWGQGVLYPSYTAGGSNRLYWHIHCTRWSSFTVCFTLFCLRFHSVACHNLSLQQKVFWICFLAPSVDPWVRCHCQPPPSHTIKANCYTRSPAGVKCSLCSFVSFWHMNVDTNTHTHIHADIYKGTHVFFCATYTFWGNCLNQNLGFEMQNV